ncbi:hypothetical protein [uncultured Cetobacterium sp.]|uniref:hypothetical protein n=1 Tax=uncultured Cetobacterium sp. TaxID=527638 RepID=UPI00262BBD7A|nr:hypothetical protein [uncultured Cetobacterium sp.]
MKKLLIIIIGIIIAGTTYHYKETNINLIKLENDIYIKNNKAYSILTDKLVSGYTTSTSWGNTDYTKYIKGIITSKKRINNNLQLLLEENFNKNGLLDGEIFKLSGDKSFIYKYKNNILNGISNLNNREIEFVDGTIVGKNSISEYQNPYNINYINGVPDFIKLEIPNNKYPEKILYNTESPSNFTGGILKKANWEMVLSEYKNGKLIRERFYSMDSNMSGLKKKDIIYGENKNILKELIYADGILDKLNSFNDKMERNGENYEKVIYSEEFFIKNYINGVLNGNSTQYIFDKDKKLNKYLGFYKLGIYTGEKYMCQYSGKYVEGFDIDKLDDLIKFEPFTIETLVEIPKKFTGYNKNENIIFEYNSGKIKKEYQPIDNIYQKVKVYNNNGSYREDTYQNGLIIETINYDKNNIRNGQYIGYAHNKLKEKTIGMIINNIMTGEFKHYHDNNIIYVDTYNGNNKSIRTRYYNYKDKKIKSISKRIFENMIWKDISLTNYDKNGNIIKNNENLKNNKLKIYNKENYEDLLFEDINQK